MTHKHCKNRPERPKTWHLNTFLTLPSIKYYIIECYFSFIKCFLCFGNSRTDKWHFQFILIQESGTNAKKNIKYEWIQQLFSLVKAKRWSRCTSTSASTACGRRVSTPNCWITRTFCDGRWRECSSRVAVTGRFAHLASTEEKGQGPRTLKEFRLKKKKLKKERMTLLLLSLGVFKKSSVQSPLRLPRLCDCAQWI